MKPRVFAPVTAFAAGLLALSARVATAQTTPASAPRGIAILAASDDAAVVLGAREIRRYTYLRTGQLLPIVAARPENGELIEVGIDASMGEQTYRLRTETRGDARVLRIEGGSGFAALYGAYEYARLLGVRFGLHGDIVPDGRIELKLPEIDRTFTPLFEHRGVQPFHDFPEGPDWWSLDDYKSLLSQLPKLRMNWIGLHCYPEGGVGPEPLVWIGLPDDVHPDGTVAWAYPSRWASTSGGSWGYGAANPEDFAAGAGLLFPSQDFGSPVTDGLRPLPGTVEESVEVFDRAGRFLDEVFAHADALGVTTVLGTETPLTIPASLRERLVARGMDPDDPATVRALYEGMFRRIEATHTLDYFWLWTPEDWTWGGTNPRQVDATLADLDAANAALDEIGRPFELGTCGWVLGPEGDRSLFDRRLPPGGAMACINRQVGFAPVEPGFAGVDGRPKWAIPWLEDDPAMIIPQLWAGRMRRDAADAAAYGCTGLMGIHWRTKVLAPNVAALADAAWDQTGWNPEPGVRIEPPPVPTRDIRLGGNAAAFSDPIEGAEDHALYQTVLWGVRGYRVAVPNGTYSVTLRFCEPHYREAGKRVFGVDLQGAAVIRGLDIFATAGHDAALDRVFDGVVVDDEVLAIDFVPEVEFPSIAGITITGTTAPSNQVAGSAFARSINCAGPALDGCEADLPEAGELGAARDLPRDLPVGDFYLDWCGANFGAALAAPMAGLFERLDGGGRSRANGRDGNLPRPCDWIAGPGGIVVNAAPWSEVAGDYAFVDEMAALRARVRGPGNLERFDYWLGTMRYLRAVGRAGCARGELDRRVQAMAAADPAGHAAAVAEALQARVDLARRWEELITLQLAVTDTIGEIGTIANLELHVRRNPLDGGRARFLEVHDDALRAALGGELPAEARPTTAYLGTPKLVVPTARTTAAAGESLAIQAIVLDRTPPRAVTLRWRLMGVGEYHTLPMPWVGGGVYRAELPPVGGESLEYMILADTAEGGELFWPSTAPGVGQTVVSAPSRAR